MSKPSICTGLETGTQKRKIIASEGVLKIKHGALFENVAIFVKIDNNISCTTFNALSFLFYKKNHLLSII